KPLPRLPEHIGCRYSYIVVGNFCMSMWCMIIAKDRQHPFNFYTWRIERDQDHSLLFMFSCCWVVFPHNNRYLTARTPRPRRPPFTPINYIYIAISDNT